MCRKDENVPPVLTKAVLQPAATAAMLCHPAGDTYPPLLVLVSCPDYFEGENSLVNCLYRLGSNI